MSVQSFRGTAYYGESAYIPVWDEILTLDPLEGLSEGNNR